MNIVNKRAYHTNKSTLGVLAIDDKPFGFIIEDEPREVKVAGETRIKADRYVLGIRKELTPLTQKYRDMFPWFEYHIELLDVADFTNIYIHIGNLESETDGCQLIGLNAHIHKTGFKNSDSRTAYERFYKMVYPELKEGKTVFYTIIDEL